MMNSEMVLGTGAADLVGVVAFYCESVVANCVSFYFDWL
jgi:hypothetical protein